MTRPDDIAEYLYYDGDGDYGDLFLFDKATRRYVKISGSVIQEALASDMADATLTPVPPIRPSGSLARTPVPPKGER